MDLSKRWAPPSDGGNVRMEAPFDREVLAGLRGLQGEEETDIVAELASVFRQASARSWKTPAHPAISREAPGSSKGSGRS
jgi:hypothetical protein